MNIFYFSKLSRSTICLITSFEFVVVSFCLFRTVLYLLCSSTSEHYIRPLGIVLKQEIKNLCLQDGHSSWRGREQNIYLFQQCSENRDEIKY